ncbi:MAG: methyltransferase domain-containing protein [Caldilinea sp.]|nr:methyltransferase domain-containing protein [Caldilinea sp.]MDW8440292.1 methyltransferase domain-containing protein [Caldilineaceae bacterium]
MTDFLSITEVPGTLLNREQLDRMALRYSLATELAVGRRVLEVACGAGVGLGLLLGVARSLAACDYSTAALTLAQQSVGAQVLLAAADAQRLPYATGAFDLIVSFEAIYYLPQPAAFLSECHRLLASGGRLLLSTSNPEWPFFAPGALSVHYPKAPELTCLMQAAGFQTVTLYGSLPVDRSLSLWGVARAHVRRLLLGAGVFRSDNALTRALKRLGYGTLTPLPPLLPASLRVNDPFHELTLLQPDRPDRRHRVLFALAEK